MIILLTLITPVLGFNGTGGDYALKAEMVAISGTGEDAEGNYTAINSYY